MVRQGPLVMIAGGILIVVGLLIMVLGAGVSVLIVVLSNEESLLTPQFLLVSTGVAAFGLVGVASGAGAWGGRTWGRVLGVFVAACGLLVGVPRLIGDGGALDGAVESIGAGFVLLALVFSWRGRISGSGTSADSTPA